MPRNFRGIRDADGNLQAGAIVTNELNHLYVDYFATAPWNILRDDVRSAKNAGTILMANLVRESISMGHEGRIKLLALSGSTSFYTKIGFLDNEDGEMVLTSERASRFLATLEG